MGLLAKIENYYFILVFIIENYLLIREFGEVGVQCSGQAELEDPSGDSFKWSV